jgi:hypothetical protein
MKHLLLTLTIAAALTAVAPASGATRGQRADGLRWQALAQWYENRPAAAHYTPAALKAMGARWNAEAHYYARLDTTHNGPNVLAYILLGVGTLAVAVAVVSVVRSRRSSLPSRPVAE